MRKYKIRTPVVFIAMLVFMLLGGFVHRGFFLLAIVALIFNNRVVRW